MDNVVARLSAVSAVEKRMWYSVLQLFGPIGVRERKRLYKILSARNGAPWIVGT